MCYDSKFGLAILLVSDQFCTIKRSRRFEERCAVYAPHSSKDMEMYEAFISNVLSVTGTTPRWSQRIQFYITGDQCGVGNGHRGAQ